MAVAETRRPVKGMGLVKRTLCRWEGCIEAAWPISWRAEGLFKVRGSGEDTCDCCEGLSSDRGAAGEVLGKSDPEQELCAIAAAIDGAVDVVATSGSGEEV